MKLALLVVATLLAPVMSSAQSSIDCKDATSIWVTGPANITEFQRVRAGALALWDSEAGRDIRLVCYGTFLLIDIDELTDLQISRGQGVSIHHDPEVPVESE